MLKAKKTFVLFVVVGLMFGLSASVLAADGDGKININTATAEELMQLKGVGEKIAQAIIEYRQTNGLFESVADLEKVKGIGPKILADNMDKLTI